MATTAELLAEARSAYHDLVTGKAVRAVTDQNGEKVEFTSANRGQLYLYIQSLEALITEPVTRPTGPARFLF